jgi:HEAT repeat protein
MVCADPDAFARRRAAFALAVFPSPSTVDALLPALRDGDVGVRCAVAYTIGCSGDQRATGILISLLSDSADEVREAAVLRLGEIGDEQVAATLEPLTMDRTGAEGVRVFAQAAVERIRARS